MSTPNFFGFLPASVRYNKNLEPNAKILYTELTALTSKEGYCWATNAYFAELYDVDIRTVQRWLDSLKQENFIKVEIVRQGIQTTRKIFLSICFQNNFTEGQKCHPPVTKTSCQPDKNVTCINTSSNTSIKPSPIPSSETPKNDDGSLESQFRKAKLSDEQVARAVAYHSKNLETIKRVARNPIGYVVSMIRSDKDKEETVAQAIIEKRKAWAAEHEYTTGAGYLSALKEGVEKAAGSIAKFIKYDANDEFWDKAGLPLFATC